MSASWRRLCRQCGRPVVRGRAWCEKHLRQVQAGRPTDLDDVPTYRDAERISAGGPDTPFPFWPTTTTKT